MGPGVPGLRGRKPFPALSVQVARTPPLGGSGTQPISGRASSGGSGYLVVPLGPEGLSQPRGPRSAAVWQPRGGLSGRGRCPPDAFMGGAPTTPITFNAMWQVAHRPPIDVRQATAPWPVCDPAMDGWDRQQRTHASLCVRRRGGLYAPSHHLQRIGVRVDTPHARELTKSSRSY
jgi:hypothetical protein